MVLPSFGLFGHAVSEEKNFFRLTNQKQELPVAAMFVYGSGRNVHSLQRAFHSYLLHSFGSLCEEVSGKIFQKLTNQKQELPVTVMFVNVSEENEHSLKTYHRCFVPSVGQFGQAISDEKIFQKSPIRNKNCLWRPFLLTYWHEM